MKVSRTIGIGLTVALLALGAAVPSFAGGWAVVTLDSLPQGVTPGTAFTIGFTVRQHGVTLLSDLDPAPRVEAENVETGDVVRSTASADSGRGHYTAGLTLPTSGEWTWGIQAFGGQVQAMPSIVVRGAPSLSADATGGPASAALGLLSAVLAVLGIGLAFRRRFVISATAILLAAIVAGVSIGSNASSSTMAEASPPVARDQGAALFVAKGCIVCHTNTDVPESESISISIGPDLSRYSNDPVFLARWLAGPASVRPTAMMPDLGLKADEIDALIAFLNGEGDA